MNCMPIWKACNRQIDYLDRSHCNLIAVPDDILRYKSLEELILDFNLLRELPKGLYKVVSLRKLSLSDNEILRLSPDIGNLVHLEEFNVSQNDLHEIPDTIKFCKCLSILDVSNNPLQRLPEGLTQLTNLTRLGLNNISLSRLPASIGSLTHLEQLDLRDNSLDMLPSSVCQLNRLKSLDIGNNSIQDLPEKLGGLSSLEELLIDNNEIGYLPKEIGSLKRLNQLDMSCNKLDRLPDDIGGLTNLTDLLLSENLLEYLPEAIGQLKKLTILKVDQNRILHLTSTIGSCQALQELIVTENLIQELPITIGKLKNLVILNADRNRLTQLPKETGSCTKLGVLSVRDNKIENIPPEIGNLKVLHVLDVSGNRLRHLPVTLGSCNLKAIWLSENQAQPMLNFQQDTDPETGQKILICFLLPQQAVLTRSTLNLMRLDRNIQPVADNRESWNGEAVEGRQSAIRFKEEDLPKVERESEGEFVRHNTPFPKDLRTRPFGKNSSHLQDGANHRSTEEPDLVGGRQSDVVVAHPSYPHKWWIPPQQQSADGIDGSDHSNYNRTSDRKVSNNSEGEESSEEEEEEDEDSIEEQEITVKFVRKPGVGLGLSIAGGVGSTPYVEDDEGIFLSRVTEDGPTWKAGLRPGDKLIEVNGNSLVDADHQRAVEVLKEAGNTVTMVVVREIKVNEQIISIVLRRGSVGLGFCIAGGKGSSIDGTKEEDVYISRITDGGLAAHDGRLRVGDRLLSINGVSVKEARHEDVVNLLRVSGSQINLTVCRAVGVDNNYSEVANNRSLASIQPLQQIQDQKPKANEEQQQKLNEPQQQRRQELEQQHQPTSKQQQQGKNPPLQDVRKQAKEVETVKQQQAAGESQQLNQHLSLNKSQELLMNQSQELLQKEKQLTESQHSDNNSNVQAVGNAATSSQQNSASLRRGNAESSRRRSRAMSDRDSVVSEEGSGKLPPTLSNSVRNSGGNVIESSGLSASNKPVQVVLPILAGDKSSTNTPIKGKLNSSSASNKSLQNSEMPKDTKGSAKSKLINKRNTVSSSPSRRPPSVAELEQSIALVARDRINNQNESPTKLSSDVKPEKDSETVQPISFTNTDSTNINTNISTNSTKSQNEIATKSSTNNNPGIDSQTSSNSSTAEQGITGSKRLVGLDDPIPHSDDTFLSYSSSSDKWSPRHITPGQPFGLDERIPHIDDEGMESLDSVYFADGYQMPYDTEEKTRRRLELGENLDYQIPHIEGRVGLLEGDTYLDPVEGRPLRESLIEMKQESYDIDKLVPHADDQVHFVKETLSHIDSFDVPSAEYQLNYMSKAQSTSADATPTSTQAQLSHTKSQPSPTKTTPSPNRAPPPATPPRRSSVSSAAAPEVLGSIPRQGSNRSAVQSTSTAQMPSSNRRPSSSNASRPISQEGQKLKSVESLEKVDTKFNPEHKEKSKTSKLSESFDKTSTNIRPAGGPLNAQDTSGSIDKTSNNNKPSSTSNMAPKVSKSSSEDKSTLNRSSDSTGGSGLYNSLERNYDGERKTGSDRRNKPPTAAARSTSLPPKEPLNTQSNGSLRRKKPAYPTEKVTIVKAGGPLGVSIVGGLDHVSHPFGVSEPGVFISKIVAGGAAARTTLRVGDRILSVNGVSIRQASHDEAVAALSAPCTEVVLEVRKDPPPLGLKEITLTKLANEKLGLSIRGGTGDQSGNPLDSSDDGIFISKVSPEGAVARDGRVKAGMRILDVNGQSLLGATHHEAVSVLRSVHDHLTITVCQGYDPAQLSSLSHSISISDSFNNNRLSSLSSIERDFDDSGIGIRYPHSVSVRSNSRVSSVEDDAKPYRRPKPPVPAKPDKLKVKGSLNSIPSATNQSQGSRSGWPTNNQPRGIRSGWPGGSLDDVRVGRQNEKILKTPKTPAARQSSTNDSFDTEGGGSLRRRKGSRSSTNTPISTLPRSDPARALVFQKSS